MLSKPTEVLKNILSLSIKLLDPFAHEWMVAEPIELWTKLLGNVFRKRANQKADAPILPDLIIAAQNAPDMWCERNADRGKKGGEDVGDGPIVVPEPLHKLSPRIGPTAG
jgi:hypothetical protein